MNNPTDMDKDKDKDKDKHERKHLGTGIAIGAIGLLVLMALAGLAVVSTGAYNVAATEEHTSLVRWAFGTTMHRSIEQRAPQEAPAAVTPAMVRAGATAYKSMCQHCHGGPGVEREPWASGMRPRPPFLVEAAVEWVPGEVFWIAKHGIRMTGMPAFGPSHDDETLWGIAAFVKALPAMTPEQYAELGDAGAHGGGSAGHPHGSGGASQGTHGGQGTPAPSGEPARR